MKKSRENTSDSLLEEKEIKSKVGDEDLGDEELLSPRYDEVSTEEEVLEDFDISEENIPPGWQVAEDDGIIRIKKDFEFETFEKAADFVKKIADLSKTTHPPDVLVSHNIVTIEVHSTGAAFSMDELNLINRIDSLL